MRRAARTAPLLALLLLAAAAEAGDEWIPGATRAAAEAALRADGPDAAASVIDAVAAAGDSSLIRPENLRACRVEAAKAAVDLLPPDLAAPRATKLLLAALRADKGSTGGAWEAAQQLRRSLLHRVDDENGEPFLRGLQEIYPGEPSYARDLGFLLLDVGRREDAKASFRSAVRISPSAVQAAMRLAWLEEQDGAQDEAIALYEGVVKARPDEMQARYAIAQIKGYVQSDFDGARTVLDEAARHASANLGAAAAESSLTRIREIRASLDERSRTRSRIREIDRRATRLLWMSGVGAAAVCAAIAFLLRDRRKG
ncbi:MAG: hypothetical protein HMLKMBBP_03318 [Planctomycetes bacterium]|nr:hypothetical protein [Planctomycetota bacterium]